MIRKKIKQWVAVLGCLCATVAMAQDTEFLYLSGTGLGNPVG